MKSNTRKQFSIGGRIRVMPILVIVLVSINLISVTLIGVKYFSLNSYDGESAEYFRVFNQYVLATRQEGTDNSNELARRYNDLTAEFKSLSRRLTRNTELPASDFSDIGKEAYASLLRAHAESIRNNLSSVVSSTYISIVIMFVIVGVISLVMLVTLLTTRKAVLRYHREINLGLDYVDKILTFRQEPGFSQKNNRILEIQHFNDMLSKLSQDISYNRKISDTAFQGNLDIIMSNLFETFKKRMPCDRIALAFIDTDDYCIAETAVTSYNNTYLQPGFREKMSRTTLTELRDTAAPRIINDLNQYASGRQVSTATRLLLREGLCSSITIPMLFDGKCLGFFFLSSLKCDAYDESMMHYISRVINLMKQKFYTEYLLQEVISETSNAFVGLMEEKDNETSAHILRMSQYSYITALAYHDHIKPLHPRFMREILWYAPLHDIGKVGTPDAILLKEGSLSKEEMHIMKQHVATGMSVIHKMNDRLNKIVSSSLLQTAVDIISGHHEKFNGKGYPEGLSGEQIPLAGRIVAVADVFDALTSKRPYKEALSVEQALEIIEGDMAESFDPDVLKAFRHGMPEVRKIYDEFKEI